MEPEVAVTVTCEVPAGVEDTAPQPVIVPSAASAIPHKTNRPKRPVRADERRR